MYKPAASKRAGHNTSENILHTSFTSCEILKQIHRCVSTLQTASPPDKNRNLKKVALNILLYLQCLSTLCIQATLQIALKFARRRDQLLDRSIVRVL